MYINNWYSIGGKDEYNGNIKNANYYLNDYYWDEVTFEKTEEKMIEHVVDNLIVPNKNYLIIGGNLSNQLTIFYNALSKYNFPVIGVYSACASFVESLILATILKQNSIVLTSTHNLVSERQFRYPIEYGSMSKNYSTSTITASVGMNVSNKKGNFKLGLCTIGKVVDSNIIDYANMGAVMAVSAAKTINEHLYNHKRTIDDYDYILTGDLGIIGKELLIDVLKNDYGIITDKIVDAGTMIYKANQKKKMGASGPSVLPFFLVNNVFNTNFKRILVVGTGSLHNTVLVNQHKTIPSIAHAIEIERVYD